MTTFTISSSKGTQTFESHLTDDRAAAILRQVRGNFASDLRFAFPRWSDKQRAWAHKLALDAETPAATAPAKPAGDAFPSIVAMFSTAHKSLKFPRITFTTKAGTVRLQRAGSQSRYNGDIMVTDGKEFGSNKFYGRIESADGNWVAGRDFQIEILEVLREIGNDPAEAISRLGKAQGECCFCGKDLTAEDSTDHGYGPVCAKNWGLPHGAKAIRVG